MKTHNQPVNGQNRTGLTIQCANPFVPASVHAQCATAGITSFTFGTANALLPNTKVRTDRRQYRFVGGLKGKFKLLSSDWSYDAYYERGINHTAVDVEDIMLNPRYNQAINATLLNGAIVCADPVARANGCQPINILGGTEPSAAARAYIMPENGPFQRLRMTQDVASLNFSGSLFDWGAGPVSVAFGAEYRKEFYEVHADPYGAGVAPISPNNADYPVDPLLSTAGNNWYAGNYKNGNGAYSVKEAFLELNVPLFNSDTFGRANINPRRPHYRIQHVRNHLGLEGWRHLGHAARRVCAYAASLRVMCVRRTCPNCSRRPSRPRCPISSIRCGT